ncbi:MAG: hypothetical protein HY730_00365 [Candidatus Tectomicrobia bacterium]|uniref:Uncharacterized protein n=1 Tax=Tectimicrobiota bacterium TaxID=2528274 RepID=A0A933GL71_UNCTE|nr:hypothetical protein [Candidatus Tectomicrobia bacterium]
MSTRGAWGFFLDGKEKVSYNHSSSYPTWLGRDIFSFPRQVMAWGKKGSDNVVPLIRIIFRQIILVPQDGKPSGKETRLCAKWAGFDVSARPPESWYDLLGLSQGNPKAYLEGLLYMTDDQEFLLDSFWAEWAYIYNLDSGRLEVYRGFNKNRKTPGRYAAGLKGEKYKGVALIGEYPIADVALMDDESIMELMRVLEGSLGKR